MNNSSFVLLSARPLIEHHRTTPHFFSGLKGKKLEKMVLLYSIRDFQFMTYYIVGTAKSLIVYMMKKEEDSSLIHFFAFLVLAMAASVAAASPSPPQILVVNSGRIDYDGAIDWHVLGEKVVTHAKDPRGDGDFIERLETCPQAVEVIVTKEIPVSAAVVRRLPKSVKLLVEAGTGYNNIALDECRKRGIIVMNVPAYSSDSVATLVMTFLLNLSSSLHRQLRRLERGDRADFVQHLQRKLAWGT